MAQKRVQVAYHFQVDPNQLVAGTVRIPEQITRTVSVGEEFNTEKVSSDCLPDADRAALIAEIDKQVREATRTARPAGALTPEGGADWKEKAEEMSAF